MPAIAFWNINDNVAAEDIRAFAREHDVDILVLAENSASPFDLLRTLNQNAERLYFSDIGHSDRLTILTRFSVTPACIVRDSQGVSIRNYDMPLNV